MYRQTNKFARSIFDALQSRLVIYSNDAIVDSRYAIMIYIATKRKQKEKGLLACIAYQCTREMMN